MTLDSYQFHLNPQQVPLQQTSNRYISSSIPAPGTTDLLRRLDNIESRSMHGQLPIVWAKAEGHSVYDHYGNKWIDFSSTIFVANVGHSNPHVISSVRLLLDQSLCSCYAYPNEIRADYLERLVDFAGPPFQKAFLLSAGTEATEAVLKLMRMYGQESDKRRLGVICIEGNWHGRTLGAQMMSSNLKQREWIGYQDENIHHIPFPYPWDVDNIDVCEFLHNSLAKLAASGISLETDICGFMLETFQGWGALFYPPEYVKEIENICRDHNILLAFDEMQSGFARTGESFGFRHYGVSPDLIACGKGMGGGFPLSGVIGKANIMDLPSVGNMSSTHSANPIVCAAGLGVLEEIKRQDLINTTKLKGGILHASLNTLKNKFDNVISYVFGKGLIASVLFKNSKGEPDAYFASMVSEKCLQKGLLVVHTGRESIKIGPPLSITEEALLEGVSVLEEAIAECLSL